MVHQVRQRDTSAHRFIIANTIQAIGSALRYTSPTLAILGELRKQGWRPQSSKVTHKDNTSRVFWHQGINKQETIFPMFAPNQISSSKKKKQMLEATNLNHILIYCSGASLSRLFPSWNAMRRTSDYPTSHRQRHQTQLFYKYRDST